MLENIKNFTVYPTNRCQLNCDYCMNVNSNEDMTLETARKVVEIANNGSVESVTFFGGEPLINFKIIKYFVENLRENIIIRLTTNAILLQGEIADFLSSHKKVRVQISLDPDMKKRSGNYEELILDNVKKFIEKNKGIDRIIEVNSVIRKENFEYYKNYYYKFLINELEFDLINSSYPRQDTSDLKIWNELENDMIDKLSNGYRPQYCGFDGYIKVNLKDNMENDGCFFCESCDKEITIAPDGSLYACYQFYNYRKFKIGHIDTSIDDELYKIWLELENKRKTQCASCNIYTTCRSGCSYNHYVNNGMFGVNDKTVCEMRKLSFEAGKRIYEKVIEKSSKMNISFLFTKNIYGKDKFRNFTVNKLKKDMHEKSDIKLLEKNFPLKDEFSIYKISEEIYGVYFHKNKKMFKIKRDLAALLEITAYEGLEYAIEYLSENNKLEDKEVINIINSKLMMIKSIYKE